MSALPANPLLLGFAGVLLVLALASLVTAGLIYARPGRNYLELKLRIQTWWWLIGALFIALTFDCRVAMISFAFLSFFAFKEFLSIVPTRRADHRVLLLAYLSIPVQYAWAGMDWYGMFIRFAPRNLGLQAGD